jgi:hypothetical protein
MNKQELEHIFGIAKETNLDICVELGSNDFVIILNANLDARLNEYINSSQKTINAFPIKWMR